MSQVSAEDISTLKTLLADVRSGAEAIKTSTQSWSTRLSTSNELSYPSGISLLSLKNHLLLSYIHHLIALFSLRLSARSLESPEGQQVVGALVKARVCLEKVGPLEGKLKYQIEKLVRKANLAEEGGDAEDVANDPLAFRPNPSNLVLDRHVSDDEDDHHDGYSTAVPGGADSGTSRDGVYRPPRIAAMPYSEGPSKKAGKDKKVLPSHMISDISSGLSGNTPYSEATSGLSVATSHALQSGTARHLAQVEDYELSNFTRMRMSKKDSKKRRNEEEEVAFGGLGAGKNGRRRLGGFGAEFDDLLVDGAGKRVQGAYEQMRGMKKAKAGPASAGVGGSHGVPDESAGTSGLAGLQSGRKPRKGKTGGSNTFDREVMRAGRMSSGKKRQ